MYRPLIPAIVTSSILISLSYAEETISLEKIQIEAFSAAIESRKEDSIAKRIISGSELGQYGDLNALDILKRTPGVSIAEGKNKKGSPGKGYTVVLIDGEETSTGSKRRISPLEQLSPDMIERIEVMTNGSAEYTAEAMGGIVNIVLKKPKSQGLTSAKFTAGAYGDKPQSSVFLQREGKVDRLSYMVNMTASNTQTSDTSSTDTFGGTSYRDERDDDGRNQSLNLTTKLIYSPTSTDKYFYDGSLFLSKNKRESDEIRSGDVSRLLQDHEKSTGLMFWSKIAGEHHLSGTELLTWKVKIHQNDQQSDRLSRQTLPTSKITTQSDDSLFRVLGAESSYSIAYGNHFIKTGAEVKQLTQHDKTTRTLNGIDTTTPEDQVTLEEKRGSLYVQDEVNMGNRMVITPGLRYENVSRDFGHTSKLDYFAPSLHVLYKLTYEDNLRASIAKTVKLPRLDDLSSSVDRSLDQNDLAHPDVSGNPDLKEEKALSYELRYEHFFVDKGIASIGGFYRSIDEKIEKMITLESGRYVERPYNIGQGNLWGIELELKKSLDSTVAGLGLFANATVQRSSLTNTATGFKRPIKETNDYLYNIGVDHTLASYKVTYGAAYRYVSGYDDPLDENGITEAQKGYGTLDIYLTKRLNTTFKLTANVKNITSETIETVSSDDNTGKMQIDQAHSRPTFLLTVEGKW
ncbi:MAG: TonB-dependent receptor [Sulfuricurvum sp.]|nr:TonB-dependent receptor [Sulfuricurvum sp.]